MDYQAKIFYLSEILGGSRDSNSFKQFQPIFAFSFRFLVNWTFEIWRIKHTYLSTRTPRYDKNVIYLIMLIYPSIKNRSRTNYHRQMGKKDKIWWKSRFHGRQPSLKNNIQLWKLLMEDNLWWKTTFDCSGPLMT